MTERSALPSTFVIERTYKASPERVFRAFSDLEQKKKWFSGPPDWNPPTWSFDFREGGVETSTGGGPKGGPTHEFESRYYDIVPNERLVYCYAMKLGDARISVSLATIEFKVAGSGTRLTLTEQGVYLDGYDKPEQREEGTRWILDELAKVVEA